MPVGIGESSDEVYRYGGERDRVFDSQRGESRYSGMGVHLGCLAIGTSRNEFSEKGGHSQPPVVFLHLVESLEETFVPPCRRLMERPY